MNLIQPIYYIGLVGLTIFFIYILVYKSYFLSASKIATPDQALEELLKGNKKYNSSWNFITKKRRKLVATIQRPFAIVLSCSDSRVPTEIIFNQLNVGSLFIVRNAGNVVEETVLGSVEYGIDQLGALLVIVLGHERCGAVSSTIDSIINHSPELSGHIKDIINAIKSAAQTILDKNNITEPISGACRDEIISKTVKENVRVTLDSLYNNSTIIAQAVDSQKIKLVGAYYDLDDGDIKLIEKA